MSPEPTQTRNTSFLVTLAATTLALAVVPVAGGTAQGTTARDSVRAVADGIIAADNRRDIEAVLSSYTRDAVLLPPNDEPVVGHDAIRPRYEMLFRTTIPAIQSELAEVQVEGAWAFVRGRNTGFMRPIARGQPERPLNDLFLMVLHRDADGRWRIARLMWHSGAPSSSAPPR